MGFGGFGPAQGVFGGDATFTNLTVTGAATFDTFNVTTLGVSGPMSAAQTLALVDTTSSTLGVVLKGTDRFIHNFHHPTGGGAVPAGQNTFVGVDAGNFTMGSTATQTYHGSYNSALGYQALIGNTTGFFNCAVGVSALGANTGGSSNCAVGLSALGGNTGGAANCAMGVNALGGNTNGGSNTAVGTGALQSNTTGSSNAALGVQAGYNAGVALQTLANSVFIGVDSRATADGLTNCVAIGYTAEVGASNTVVLGNTAIVQTNITGDVSFKTTGANGQYAAIKSLTEAHTLAAAATSDTTIEIPAGAMVVGVSVRVTTLITGCATLDVGVAGATTRYGTGIALAATTTSATAGTDAAPTIYQAATKIRMTATGGGASFTAGVVRVTVHYIQISAPTA